MQRAQLPLLTLTALCVLAYLCANNCSAGILLPQQISVDADELEQLLDSGDSASTGASSSPARRHSPEWPTDSGDQPSSPLELSNSLPTGSTSSSTTSSSPGGTVGSGVVLCVLNSTLTLQDDSPLGTLAEDQGFSLPEPSGTDLLRPPRECLA